MARGGSEVFKNIVFNLIATLLLAVFGVAAVRLGFAKSPGLDSPKDFGLLILLLIFVASVIWGRGALANLALRTKVRFASGGRIAVLVAAFDGDLEGKGRERVRAAIRKDFSGGIELAFWPKVLTLQLGDDTTAQASAHATARRWLGQTGHDVLIWGKVDDEGALWLDFVGRRLSMQNPVFQLDASRRLVPAFSERLSTFIATVLAKEALDRHQLAEPSTRTVLGRVDQILGAKLGPFARIALLLGRSSMLSELGEREIDNGVMQASVIDGEEALRLADDQMIRIPVAAPLLVIATSQRILSERLNDGELLERAIGNLERASQAWSVAEGPVLKALIDLALAKAHAAHAHRLGDAISIQAAARRLREFADNVPADIDRSTWADAKLALAAFYVENHAVLGLGPWIEQAAELTNEVLERTDVTSEANRWATAQHMRGVALSEQFKSDRNCDLLRGAIRAFDAALAAEPGQEKSAHGLNTRRRRAIALARLGFNARDIGVLDAASVGLLSVLAETPRQSLPLEWANLQVEIGRTRMRIGEMTAQASHFNDAASHIGDAIDVLRSQADPNLPAAELLRAQAICATGLITEAVQTLRTGVDSLRDALEAIGNSADCEAVASAYVQLAITLNSLAQRSPSDLDARVEARSAASKGRAMFAGLYSTEGVEWADRILRAW